MTNKDRLPGVAFPVGEHIKEELEAWGWSVEVLAESMGLSAIWVAKMLDPAFSFTYEGSDTISCPLAEKLGAAFGTSAELWLNLDFTYWSWKAAQGRKDA